MDIDRRVTNFDDFKDIFWEIFSSKPKYVYR